MTSLGELQADVTYRLVRFVAEGGMGLVYEATQAGAREFRKRVAVKIIRERFARLKAFRANFVGEARLVADLIHPNIVQIYNFGEQAHRVFMIMEFVDGYNLEEFLLQHQALRLNVPIDLAVFLVSRICRALAYAHRKCDKDGRPLRIVHRDVNPRNILLGHEGHVKLTDFGIAKARDLMFNEEGSIIAGKEDYLSPEQARKEVTDERADIFSCGVVLAELLFGENPFTGNTPEETLANVLDLPLPEFGAHRDGIDDRLVRVLHRALDRDRNRRYQTAHEFLRDLELYLYSDHYGPTTEKLAAYNRVLFAKGPAFPPDPAVAIRRANPVF